MPIPRSSGHTMLLEDASSTYFHMGPNPVGTNAAANQWTIISQSATLEAGNGLGSKICQGPVSLLQILPRACIKICLVGGCSSRKMAFHASSPPHGIMCWDGGSWKRGSISFCVRAQPFPWVARPGFGVVKSIASLSTRGSSLLNKRRSFFPHCCWISGIFL